MNRLSRSRWLALVLGAVLLVSCGKKEPEQSSQTDKPAAVAAKPAKVEAAPESAPLDPALVKKGQKLFTEKGCVACHGADAKTSLIPEYPKLAGQNHDYARQQMIDIKNGVRTNGQTAAMKAIMAMVSDEEIEALATWLSTLPDQPASAAAQDKKSPGARLFKTKTCFTCHGKDAKTPLLPEYPLLAGQNAAYALQQMKDIQSGARANGQSAGMKGVMHLVNDEELVVLADWLASLVP